MTETGAAIGRVDGDRHLMPVRVYWEDTDAGGIVYYANYLRFIERARSDMLRLLGIDQRRMLDDGGGAMFAVRDVRIEYLKPARLDDDLEVETRLAEMGGATITLTQNVWRSADLIVRSLVRAAFIGLDGRPRRLPSLVRERLRKLVEEGGEQAT